ncbi:MAG: hypothetical protein DRR19_13780 [Candidatus Parabeggiatoa sp. nov. 1]|nr:MAG: hypothetical protein DRR19_13780 [Gammaproteobacteria bacterium]
MPIYYTKAYLTSERSLHNDQLPMIYIPFYIKCTKKNRCPHWRAGKKKIKKTQKKTAKTKKPKIKN